VRGGPKSRRSDLQELCGSYRMLPTLYKLEGVMKEGDRPQRISNTAEIWKGRYKDEAVMLKILRVPRRDPHILELKSVSMLHVPPAWVACRYSDRCHSGFAGE